MARKRDACVYYYALLQRRSYKACKPSIDAACNGQSQSVEQRFCVRGIRLATLARMRERLGDDEQLTVASVTRRNVVRVNFSDGDIDSGYLGT
jgi:hypothetical protein